MTTKELKKNRTYQVRYYDQGHKVERSFTTKEMIEKLLDKKVNVEVYNTLHYELVRKDTK